MTLTLGKKKCRGGLNVCMNYEFNLLHHVGVVAKRVCAAAVAETAAETAAHEGDDNTPSGPTGRGVKIRFAFIKRGVLIFLILVDNTESASPPYPINWPKKITKIYSPVPNIDKPFRLLKPRPILHTGSFVVVRFV